MAKKKTTTKKTTSTAKKRTTKPKKAPTATLFPDPKPAAKATTPATTVRTKPKKPTETVPKPTTKKDATVNLFTQPESVETARAAARQDAGRPIRIVGARQHNLKNISVDIPRDSLVVITGPSGSGKSSLAFDTLYAEGQRRYVESLSAYARQFLDQMQKPEVEHIEGLSPAIAIEQRSAGSSPRSIVATTTEIYDYLRLLYAHIGKPHCPSCGTPLKGQSAQQICDHLLAMPEGRKMMLLAPYVRGKKGEHREVLEKMRKDGYVRARVDGEIRSLEDDDIVLEKTFAHSLEAVVDRLVTGRVDRGRLNDSVERSLRNGDGLLVLLLEDEAAAGGWHEETISETLACPACNISIGELLPRNFSFNSPYGACSTCAGLGTQDVIDPDGVIEPKKSLSGGAIPLWRTGPRRLIMYHNRLLECLADHYKFDAGTPFEKLPKKVQEKVLYGSGDEAVDFKFRWGGRAHAVSKPFEGIIPNLERRYKETESVTLRERLKKVMSRRPCPSCGGARLRASSLAVTVRDTSIVDFARMSVDVAHRFAEELDLQGEEQVIAYEILREIRARLGFLKSVGLGYLNLNRESGTLSGGEAQRIRLATQVGSGLVGVLYVLDEPSIGLHQRDNRKLLDTLIRLQSLGNTVVVVEHDLETIETADYVIDLGPGAGEHGGQLMAAGPPAMIAANPKSLTGQYLSGTRRVELPESRNPGIGKSITVKGAAANNLQTIDVSFPLGTFTCVTGVSGSGKSTLVNEILVKAMTRHFGGTRHLPGKHKAITGLEHIEKMICIDQSPIGRTPRSNPATYTGAFDLIRALFAKLPDSRMRGYKPGRFSFNVKGGRCEDCTGDGIKKIEMQFLPDVYVTCESCKGHRYNRETLTVTYRGRNISEVLDMTCEAGAEYFKAVPKLHRILSTIVDVGLGYVKLGQPATTLSGGEAQRVKLASELARPARGHTLYVLDEPTTGLHMDDVNKLLQVLLSLRDQGNTVLVIEHNLDVIKVADHLVDLGPEGGDHGGRLVAYGTPEDVAANEMSYTGQFLKEILERESRLPARS